METFKLEQLRRGFNTLIQGFNTNIIDLLDLAYLFIYFFTCYLLSKDVSLSLKGKIRWSARLSGNKITFL